MTLLEITDVRSYCILTICRSPTNIFSSNSKIQDGDELDKICHSDAEQDTDDDLNIGS